MTVKKSNALSGCLSFIVLAFVISVCMVPVFRFAGGLTVESDYAIQTTGSILCPADTNPTGSEYQTTRKGANGRRIPTTQVSLQCVTEQGTVVKDDPFIYPLIWMGGFMVIGVIIALVLSVVFAVPGGILIARIIEKLKPAKPITTT